MASRKGGNIAAAVAKIASPIAQELGLSIWHIEFVKEGAMHYLRIYIDKAGGVGIDDCEAFSRAIDAPLDEADPIDESYCLEVSTPGIERELKTERHFEMEKGKKIKVRLIRPDALGKRDYEGILSNFGGKTVTIDTQEGKVDIMRADAVYFKLCDEQSDD